MTLRRRTLAYLALAAIASCALTVGVGVVLVRNKLAAQRMTALETQANVLALIGGVNRALAPGQHVYAIRRGRPRPVGATRSAVVLAAIPPAGDAQGNAEAGGRSIIYVARTTGVGRIVLVRSAGLAFAEWRPFLESLVLAGLGGALLAVALSYLLARHLTRPLADLSSATVRVAAGETGVAVPVRGEDELAQLGSAFNEMSTSLSDAREAQRSFLESVSHELKTPLTSIRGYAEGVGDGAITSTEGARVIGAEADRLERLVQDLLDLARVDRSDFSVAHEPLDLAAVAQQAIERHQPEAREQSVTLSRTQADGAAATGDSERLLQATSNLIENALRVTPAGGEIVVSVKAGEIAVRDTGPGLAEEDVPRAFERFYLYDRYRSERPVGSGLGLAIVQQLVAAMGGTVRAANAPGGGAEFTIKLPPRNPSS